MVAPLIAFALIALAPAQKLSLDVNAKDKEVISGEKSFAVKVQSKNPVTQVEFYVNSELRDTDSSTPYEFKLDTLAEDDGEVKLKFAVYTNEGENANRTLTLKVDNGVSKGASFHVDKAKESLIVSKWDDAITAGRIALKADAKSHDARVVLARAYMGKGVWDKAQKYADDVLAASPNDVQALELVAAVNLSKAFGTIQTSGERAEFTNTISEAIKTAVTARRKSLDHQMDSFGTITDANRLMWADLALKAGRYSAIIDEFTPLFRRDPKNNDIANRLAYAQIRSGRWTLARDTLEQIRRYGLMDAYGYALDAVFQVEVGDEKKADDAIREAILSDPDNLGVKSAQAFIALKRNKTNVLAQLARDLSATESQRSEVNYYVSALSNRLNDPKGWTYFRRTVMTEPTNYDMYIEAGNYALGLAIGGRLAQKDALAQLSFAKSLYEAALIANPSSAQALTGISLVSLAAGNAKDAVKYAQAATASAPQYAAGHYVLSAALVPAGRATDAAASMAVAGKLDGPGLGGRSIPKLHPAMLYFAINGRTVVLVPPGR